MVKMRVSRNDEIPSPETDGRVLGFAKNKQGGPIGPPCSYSAIMPNQLLQPHRQEKFLR